MKRVYLKLFLTILLTNILISCDETNDSTKGTSNSSAKADAEVETEDFEISKVSDLRFENQDKDVYLFLNFEMTNNTISRITNFSFLGFIEIKFKNEKTIFVPTPYVDRTEEEYGNLAITPTPDPKIDVKHPWAPKTKIKLKFTVPRNYASTNWDSHDLHKSYFQRTPEEVLFVYKYKAISVDGEYTKTVRYNIIDQWKNYQEKIGLR